MNQMIFSDPIKLNAIRYAKKEALSFNGRRFTYKEFNERINQLAHAFKEIGIKQGDKVAFMLLNCNELFETIYACSKIGAVFIPINARFVGREIKHVLNDSRADLLIFDHRFSSQIREVVDQLSTTKLFITVGEVAVPASVEYERWISDYPKVEPIPEQPLHESDTICYLYTGGTTGLPKGAVRSHRSMYLVGLLFSIEFSIGRNGKGLAAGPLFGAAALSISMPNFFVGNPVHIIERFHPEELLKAIDEEKVTTTFLAPPMLDAIFALPEEIQQKYDVSSIKSVISVGAPLLGGTKNKTMDFFKEAELNEFYGASEHGGSTNLFPEYMNEKDRSVGLPMLGMEVKLVDEDGDEVDRGEVGEILVKGLTLCDEYYGNLEATEAAFRGEWLGLGDMAKQDDEGFYYLVDRKQDMILSGAINVYPAEIEEVLYEHPDVTEAAVIGMSNDKWGEVPMAIIHLREGSDLHEEELLAFCKGKMADYKIPHEVQFVDDPLPRSLQGKVLKYKLRSTYVSS
ncbi:AMP-binding protein [Pseudogracilibacillus auburnensis]|uniref:Fatty-acyl-CoA synthase/long-chain acyl-CoA synthetase n=1 Tax=Pseudogracilibacillus auburnensis TaxID=1494959 RepID=A0A2V3W526_9BACI|nr:AMP-binding protein [Pseudogracilibacillus auburnensis]MBO1001671.1 AMP-binding protein [Pseudogracilibacillus auburnensis]PXW89407.1 fatty-acyl-CoA synthase/long-chain acyl-CoA synthetase [Pseudogracilibacillus auburnensis]